jgi:hypothetical protein
LASGGILSKKNRWQRKLATKTAQWQCARAENTQLVHQLGQALRRQQDMQRLQRQAQASAAELSRINRAYGEAFERMASIVGRECIAAGVALHRVFPHYVRDYPSRQYFMPEYLTPPFVLQDQVLHQRTSLMLRILRAHPVVVDSLSQQVHFRAALGEHRMECVYGISDLALARMDAEMLTELISAELAGLLVEQVKRVGLR